MKLLEKIHKFLQEKYNLSEKEIAEYDGSTVNIAKEIALFAHRNQLRDNGENYSVHPFKCLELYDGFIKTAPKESDFTYKKKLSEMGIPFKGVREVCVLHDVIEDTELSIDDVAEIFNEFGHGEYFRLYVLEPLKLITREKNVLYSDYMEKVLTNPVSAIVKMMDMTDNVNLLGLAELNEKNLARSKRYLDYIKVINDKYRFIEKAARLKKS